MQTRLPSALCHKAQLAYEWWVEACWPLPPDTAAETMAGDTSLSCDTTSVPLWSKASLVLPGGVHVVLCDCYGILTNDLLACSTETTLPTVGGEPWRSVSGSAIISMK
jgi:hypothetical protein